MLGGVLQGQQLCVGGHVAVETVLAPPSCSVSYVLNMQSRSNHLLILTFGWGFVPFGPAGFPHPDPGACLRVHIVLKGIVAGTEALLLWRAIAEETFHHFCQFLGLGPQRHQHNTPFGRCGTVQGCGICLQPPQPESCAVLFVFCCGCHCWVDALLWLVVAAQWCPSRVEYHATVHAHALSNAHMTFF